MKKAISIIIFLMLISTVMATLDDRRPTPRPYQMFFTYASEPVQGLRIAFTVDSEVVVKTTNENGGVQVDLDLGYGDFKIGKSLTELELLNKELKVVCGFPACNKNIKIGDISTPHTESFLLTTPPPQVVCPACPSCGGGGGSSWSEARCRSTYPCPEKEDCTYTKSKCSSLYPCETTTCPEVPPEECTPVDCVPQDCDNIEVECPEGQFTPLSIGIIVLALIVGLIIGFIVGKRMG